MSKKVAVLGQGWQPAECALTLAELGIEVELLVPGQVLATDSSAYGVNYWPLLLKVLANPRIKISPDVELSSLSGQKGDFKLKYRRLPRFIKTELCTACGECAKVCPVELPGGKAIHAPCSEKSLPSTFVIEKEGISPCRAACPLGINVHAYVALIHQGKAEKALELINETAPLAGVLGRLCTHPCEEKCARQKVDNPLFIQALHRYAADSLKDGPVYKKTLDASDKPDKIAVIGSGPAGLTAAWELARRGYRPVIFESADMAGGMLSGGIPAFRLPLEVRQKEISAILDLGVEIQLNQQFGRDLTAESLRKDGYQAIFLAIGAHSNNRLNVPGEDMEGVINCLTWLRDFNRGRHKQSAEKIVIIGGGNSAVDSARSARRLSPSGARILCLTETMTAVKEEVEETEKEQIPIDYNVSVLEVTGENGRVKGLRCVRVKNVVFKADGSFTLEQIPGSEFFVEADKVIVAIGQRPDTALLNLADLKTGRNQTISADPLTLETSHKGVFAGGDAVTGSKNVVSAMAAGLRAAESIDRYLQGVSLSAGRTLEPLQAVEVDPQKRLIARQTRAKMPDLKPSERKNNSLETNLGLTAAQAAQESSRCLNCAGCCECLQCESVCEVQAVNHQDAAGESELSAQGLIVFDNKLPENLRHKGVFLYKTGQSGGYVPDVAGVARLSLEAALALSLLPCETGLQPVQTGRTQADTSVKPAIFLCTCGDSTGSVLDITAIEKRLSARPESGRIFRIAQSCTPEGAAEIVQKAVSAGSRKIVVGACRCCNWDQICFSCTDRRVMCLQNLKKALPDGVEIEFACIREMGAWLYKDDPAGATENALQNVYAAVKRINKTVRPLFAGGEIDSRILIISYGPAGLETARLLSAMGLPVTLLSGLDSSKITALADEYKEKLAGLIGELEISGVDILPWPQKLSLDGQPGHYLVELPDGRKLECGAVVLDIDEAPLNRTGFLAGSNVLLRVIQRSRSGIYHSAENNSNYYHYSIGETNGLIFINSRDMRGWSDQLLLAAAAAVKTAGYLNRHLLQCRNNAAVINIKYCRGCGDCAAVCPLIEIKPAAGGQCYATVDPALCLGCGACLSVCPTGAISQYDQDDVAISTSLEAIFKGDSGL